MPILAIGCGLLWRNVLFHFVWSWQMSCHSTLSRGSTWVGHMTHQGQPETFHGIVTGCCETDASHSNGCPYLDAVGLGAAKGLLPTTLGKAHCQVRIESTLRATELRGKDLRITFYSTSYYGKSLQYFVKWAGSPLCLSYFTVDFCHLQARGFWPT